jgi:hypothetical protein
MDNSSPPKKWIVPAISTSVAILLVTSCVQSPDAEAPATAGTLTAGTAPASGETAGPAERSPERASAGPEGNSPTAGTGTAPPVPGESVISSEVTLDWAVPPRGFRVEHSEASTAKPTQVPESGALVEIGAGQHPSASPPYDQISFRFQDSFPSYTVEYVPELFADPSGNRISMPNVAQILKVTFHGTSSFFLSEDGSMVETVKEAPAENIGYRTLARYAPAGDFEGVLIYGIGVGRSPKDAPQTKVRIYEVERIERGRRTCIIAIQLDATNWQ